MEQQYPEFTLIKTSINNWKKTKQKIEKNNKKKIMPLYTVEKIDQTS